MRKLFALIVVLGFLPLHAASADAVEVLPGGLPLEEVAKIRNIILAQKEAFQADDAEKAFSFAAPKLRRVFRTPEVFLHMVRKSYRAVYRPQSFEFRPIKRIGGNIVQPVAVVGPTGVAETALYIMESQPDGSWKIGACIMAQEPGEAT